MNYLQNNKKSFLRQKSPIKAAFIFLILIIALNFIQPTILTAPLVSVAVPILKIQASVYGKLGDFLTFFSSKSDLEQENQRLKNSLVIADLGQFELDVYKRENLELKELLGRAKNEKRILSAVIGKPPHTPYDLLTIDIGRSTGILSGMPVAVMDVIIGRVEEVYSESARVKLYSSPGEVTTVLVGPSRIHADAYGRGAGNFTFKIPKGLPVMKGDTITLPSINLKIFGVVREVESNIPDSFQTIFFTSPVDQTTLKWVEVIVN